jgi:hypothetical protein
MLLLLLFLLLLLAVLTMIGKSRVDSTSYATPFFVLGVKKAAVAPSGPT